jgi:hypothetical protein
MTWLGINFIDLQQLPTITLDEWWILMTGSFSPNQKAPRPPYFLENLE